MYFLVIFAAVMGVEGLTWWPSKIYGNVSAPGYLLYKPPIKECLDKSIFFRR
jgi:hypothetical protein